MTLQDAMPLAVYGLPLSIVWAVWGWSRGWLERRSRAHLREAEQIRMLEPPSLHPHIDLNRCVGCGTCTRVCPEGEVLGLIDGKSRLVQPANCIGHGACKAACPLGAITLVFGTETRGIDIPTVDPRFETNVPGVFIAGELGGMGLIRNAIGQGCAAIDAIRERARSNTEFDLDVLVVGAGPAGFAATLAAKEHGLRCATIEQETLGGTVSHYPRGKIVMTAPVHLPLHGKVKLRETTKEALLDLWRRVERSSGIAIRYEERMEQIERSGNGFEVQTTRASYTAHSVLLCIGRRGTPRKLGVPGEEQSKVVYRLIEPEQYQGQHVLVVGGGDSALEAATTIAEEPDTTVALSYRGPSFSRAKSKNRNKVAAASETGRLKLLMESQIQEILGDRTRIGHAGETVEMPNDTVIVCAGGILPTRMLTSLGIEVETKHGTQ